MAIDRIVCACGKRWVPVGEKKCRKCRRADRRKEIHEEYKKRRVEIVKRNLARLAERDARKVQKSGSS